MMKTYLFWQKFMFYAFILLLLLIWKSNIIYHFCLRFILWLEGKMPLRVVSFLDKMTDKKIMEDNRLIFKQKDGGENKKRGTTWRFRHKILQDYFANGGF
jgi:hypothetical protein